MAQVPQEVLAAMLNWASPLAADRRGYHFLTEAEIAGSYGSEIRGRYLLEGYDLGTLGVFNSASESAFGKAMDAWKDSVALGSGATRQETPDGAGILVVAVSDLREPGGKTAGASTGILSDGRRVILVNTAMNPLASLVPGTEGFWALLHEIGHALGLNHPFATAEKTAAVPDGTNDTDHTVMSYTSAGGSLDSVMPALFDIAVAQSMYAPNAATRGAGGSVYLFLDEFGTVSYESNGQTFRSMTLTPAAFTIWDGGVAGDGDVIDASAFNINSKITLLDGEFSSIGGYKASIAYGVTIENAIGGGGADTLTGNDAVNILEGRGKDDRMFGGRGADTLYGGNQDGSSESGNDTLDGGGADGAVDRLIGGDGNDRYILHVGGGKDVIVDSSGDDWIFEDTASGKLISLGRLHAWEVDGATNTWQTADGRIRFTRNSPLTITDTVTGLEVVIEDWQEGDFDIHLNDLPDEIEATRTIYGDREWRDFDPPNGEYRPDDLGNVERTDVVEEGQFDHLVDSEGSDHIISGGGSDVIEYDYSSLYGGGTGSRGRGGDDWIETGEGRDLVFSGTGDDLIEGGGGGTMADLGYGTVIETEYGGDILHGGIGDDEIHGETRLSFAAAIAAGNSQNGTGLRGDMLSGNDGDDILVGGADDDLLAGGAGDDLLIGGAGDDNILADTEWRSWTYGWSYFDEPAQPGQRTGTRVFEGFYGSIYADGSGADTVYAGNGKDFVRTGYGDDVIYGEGGVDDLVGEAGSDLIYGGDGDDGISGDGTYWLNESEHGDDFIDGGAGDDSLQGNGGDDIIVGGSGNDSLWGDDAYVVAQGDDYLNGGDGDDHLEGQGGDDELVGGSGADEMLGGEGADFMEGGDGNDTMMGEAGNDFLQGDAGDDYLDGGGEDDVLLGDDGNDTLRGGAGTDHLDGGDGNDFLDGGEGEDVLSGGAGADVLDGGAGDDVLFAGFDGDFVNDSAGQNTLQIGYGGDLSNLLIYQAETTEGEELLVLQDELGRQIYVVNGFSGAMSSFGFGGGAVTRGELMGAAQVGTLNLSGGAGSQHFIGGGSADTINGGAGADTLQGGGGNDHYIVDDAGDAIIELAGGGYDLVESTISYALGDHVEALMLVGTAAIGSGNTLDNSLTGNSAANTLDGGAGNDSLAGGYGADTYLFASGSGQDVVHESDDGLNAVDKVVFGAGIAAADVTVSRSGNNLVLTIAATGDQLTVENYLAAAASVVEEFHFADGTIWSETTIAEKLSTGTAGNDTIFGTAGNDILSGLAGNDNLHGQGGDDRLYGGADFDNLNGNAGNDLLDGGTGWDALAGGAGADTYIFARGYELDSISESADATNPVDRVQFGADILSTDVTARREGSHLSIYVNGTDDRLLVSNFFNNEAAGPQVVEEFRFGDGVVWDVAAVKAQVLLPTEGADTLTGYASDDVIGGAGSGDSIDGGGGNDTLSGGAGNDNLTGGAGDDSLRGGADNDTLNAGAGSDTYYYDLGDGRDIINNGDASAATLDRLVLGGGLLPSNVVLTRGGTTADLYIMQGNQVLVEIRGYFATGGTGELDEIRFADDPAAVWTVDAVKALLLTADDNANTLVGYETADTIDGLGGNDTIYGRGGNDTLLGGAGNDEVRGETGDDTIEGGTGDDRLYGNVGADVLRGGAGSDQLYGEDSDAEGSGADTLDGGAGADTLAGRRGDDVYVFGRGYGHDTVDETWASDGNDTLRLGAGVLPADVALFRHGDDLAITIAGDGAQAWVLQYFTLANKPLEQIMFDDATVWDTAAIASRVTSGTQNTQTGTAANNSFVVDHVGDTIVEAAGGGIDTVQSWVTHTLAANVENLTLTGTLDIDATGNDLDNVVTGNAGNNRIDGKAGNDTLAGGAGDDTYVLTPSADDDTIVEMAGGGTDTVLADFSYALEANIENLVVQSSYIFNLTATGNALDNVIDASQRSGWETTIDGGAGADIMIGDVRGFTTYYVDDAGDQAVEAESIFNSTDRVRSSVDYTLGARIEELELIAGSAAVNGTGNEANNSLSGNQNANVLRGLDGRDTLFGADGADTLIGGTGDDTYYLADQRFDLFNGPVYGAAPGSANQDLVLEQAGEGVDQVFSLFDYTLADNVENLMLLSYGSGPGAVIPIRATGNALANSIIGNGADNIIDGGAGADEMRGRTGNDTYHVDEVGDVVTEFLGEGDGDTVVTQLDYVLGAEVENLVLTGSAAVTGTGNDLDNILDGSQNAAGNVLTGGLGNDSYLVGTGDIIVENAGEGSDTVLTAVSYTLGANIENLVLTGSAATAGTGDAGNNVLDGSQNAAANTLAGGEGDDTYVVDGADLIVENAGEGIDTVVAAFDYTLAANVENLTLAGDALAGTGNSGANVILGNGWDNLLDGGAGADVLHGIWGNDTYVVDDAGDFTDETDPTWGGDAGGFDTVRASVSCALGDYIENLELTGAGAIDGTGNAYDNTLTGNGAANTLDGGEGSDTLIGGAGNDTYRFARGSGNDVIVENDATAGNLDTLQMAAGIAVSDVRGTRSGNDLVLGILGTSDSLTLAAFFAGQSNEIERVTFADGTVWDVNALKASVAINGTAGADTLSGTSGDDNIFGFGGNDTLNGNAGNDYLDGGTGNDTMNGGTGNDAYVVDATGDVVTESSSSGGTDTVLSSVTRTLGTNQENLTLTGSGSINGTGNSLANILTGNSGNNTLNGSTGADSMAGGAGNDIYVVDNAGDVVTENAGEGVDLVQSSVTYTLSAEVENLTLTGSGAINGTGNAHDNVLTGNSGTNRLEGRAGNDTYAVNSSSDTAVEAANEGVDTVQSSVTYTIGANVENLTLTGSSAINGTGNALNNVLTGNSANNTLTGLGGNDTYFVTSGDTVTEAANGGEDLVNAGFTYTLGSNVENLILTGTGAINGTGNTLNNLLRGNSAVNTLTGLAGNDVLEGGEGNDTLTDSGGKNLLNGQGGADTLNGNSGNELLVGGTGNDTINTGAGADIIGFNRGDGVDTVAVSTVKDNSVSLGGGIRYADLFFQKSGNNLILKTAGTGSTEQMTFTNWYSAAANRSVLNLQVVVEAGADFDAGSGDALLNRKVARFNFDGLVNAFDAALVVTPGISNWALTDALLANHLAGSDSDALGGDLAYQYGRFGNLANAGTVGAQNVLAGAAFGSGTQAFQALPSLQEGIARLT